MAPSYNSAIAFERSIGIGSFKYINNVCKLEVVASARTTAIPIVPPGINSAIGLKRNKALCVAINFANTSKIGA